MSTCRWDRPRPPADHTTSSSASRSVWSRWPATSTTETWTWATGETALLRFVTVHKVVDGEITLWKDYWDMAGLTAHAPPTWLADLADADMSWVFDATGLI